MRKNMKTLKLNRDTICLMERSELGAVAGATAGGGCSYSLCNTVYVRSGCPQTCVC
jgi:hypothetical protein